MKSCDFRRPQVNNGNFVPRFSLSLCSMFKISNEIISFKIIQLIFKSITLQKINTYEVKNKFVTQLVYFVSVLYFLLVLIGPKIIAISLQCVELTTLEIIFTHPNLLEYSVNVVGVHFSLQIQAYSCKFYIHLEKCLWGLSEIFRTTNAKPNKTLKH